MARDRLPWFRFYARDFMDDERVRIADLATRGAYITLLCQQWHEGSIPADELEAVRLIGADWDDEDERAAIRQAMQFFEPDSDGRLANRRLKSIAQEQDQVQSVRSRAGVTSGKKRRLPKRTHVEHMLNKRSTHAEQTLNDSDTESESEEMLATSTLPPTPPIEKRTYLGRGRTARRSPADKPPGPDPDAAPGRRHTNPPGETGLLVDEMVEVLNRTEGRNGAERDDRPTLLLIARHVPRSIITQALQDTVDTQLQHKAGERETPVHYPAYFTTRIRQRCVAAGVEVPLRVEGQSG